MVKKIFQIRYGAVWVIYKKVYRFLICEVIYTNKVKNVGFCINQKEQ